MVSSSCWDCWFPCGGGPRILLAPRWRSARRLSSSIWWECHVSESRVGVLYRALHAWRFPALIGFGHAHPCFLSGYLVSEGSLWSSTSCYRHVARFLGPRWGPLAENATKSRIWGLALVVQVFAAMWNWLGDLWLWSKSHGSGGDNNKKVHCLTLQDDNPKFTILLVLYLRC
jgi:hypothetical protein